MYSMYLNLNPMNLNVLVNNFLTRMYIILENNNCIFYYDIEYFIIYNFQLFFHYGCMILETNILKYLGRLNPPPKPHPKFCL